MSIDVALYIQYLIRAMNLLHYIISNIRSCLRVDGWLKADLESVSRPTQKISINWLISYFIYLITCTNYLENLAWKIFSYVNICNQILMIMNEWIIKFRNSATQWKFQIIYYTEMPWRIAGYLLQILKQRIVKI